MIQVSANRRVRLYAYIGVVTATALAAFAVGIAVWGPPNFLHAIFFWVLVAFADRFPIEAKIHGIPVAGVGARRPVVSGGLLVMMAAALATNPPTAALVALASPLVPGMWRGPLRATFNGAQASLYAGAASATYLSLHAFLGGSSIALLASSIAAALVAVGLNTCLVAGVIAIERARSPLAVLREMTWSAVTTVPFGLIALVIAMLYEQAGPVAGVFVVSPVLVLRGVRHSKVSLEDAQERTLRAFVRTVELKDPYTCRHSERVAAIAVELHRELGARAEEIERRYYGALLHDIGKVAVSGRILTKPGRLTDDEFEVVQRHPATGAFVVGGVGFLSDVVLEVLHHHERLDGRGYPAGLGGTDIPYDARVLAVADTFEALTSDRPYRRGLTQQEALAEIKRSSGSQLDPVVVEALARLVEAGQIFTALPRRDLEPAGGTRHLQLAREA